MAQDIDPLTLVTGPSPGAELRDAARKTGRKHRVADKAARLQARRAKKREDHEREMDQRIDETLKMLRLGLEGFCEQHFLPGGGSARADGRAGNRSTTDKRGVPILSQAGAFNNSMSPLSSGSLHQMGTAGTVGTVGTVGRVEVTRQSPLGNGMEALASLRGLSVKDDSMHAVGVQGCTENFPESWAAFSRVCSSAGLDPLLLYHGLWLKHDALSDTATSLAYKRYLNALSVVILDVCDAQRVLTGGLCALDRMVTRVQRRGGTWMDTRGKEQVRRDIVCAVEAMRVALAEVEDGGVLSQKSSIGLITINGQAYVSTVDFVLDNDCMELLKLFEKAREGITRRDAMDELRWTEERVVDGLQKLMRDGIVWLDLPPEAMPPLYWCLCMT